MRAPPNSFNFMQFLGKFGKIVCWRPLESWRPHLGEILDPLLPNVMPSFVVKDYHKRAYMQKSGKHMCDRKHDCDISTFRPR